MLYTDFCQEFGGAVRKKDVPSAYASLMRELGRILVRDKQDFVDLLNESGYEAEIVDSDIDLVDTFVENVGNSPSLMLGASMLAAAHNRKMGFDGEDNYLDDELVKSSYRVMVDYNENYANAAGAIVAGALQTTSAGLGLAQSAAERKRERESAGVKAYEQKEASKQQIVTGILEAKKQQQEALKSEQEREAKTRNILYITGGAVVAIAVIGIVIYSIRKK